MSRNGRAPIRRRPDSTSMRFISTSRIPELAHCRDAQQVIQSSGFQVALEECRAAPLVDYTAAAALKIRILRMLFRAFAEGTDKARKDDVCHFRATHGKSLERWAIFQVLREHFSRDDPKWADWRRWPQEFQDAGS